METVAFGGQRGFDPFDLPISPGDPAQSELWSQSWGREAPRMWMFNDYVINGVMGPL